MLELVIILLFYLLFWLHCYTKKNLDSFLTNTLRIQSTAIQQELLSSVWSSWPGLTKTIQPQVCTLTKIITKVMMSRQLKLNETSRSKSASELYRPSARRLSAKSLPTVSGKRVLQGQRVRSQRPYSRFSRQEPLLFYQAAPQLYSRGWGWVDPVSNPLLFFPW
jgi:hypothetical protein